VNAAELGLGCWSFGGKGGAPDDGRSQQILAGARREGIVHWDTAQDYGNGHSETVLGRFLADQPGTVFVATKMAYTADRDEVFRQVNASRDRLKVSTIDLFYIHWPRGGIDPAPMVEALEVCRSKGWIGALGVSNFSVAEMKAAARAGTLDYHQMGYNLAWRFPEEDVLPYCLQAGIRVVVYSPLAQGLLTDRGGEPDRWDPADPRRNTVFYRPDLWPTVHGAWEQMRAVAAEADTTLEDLALRWVLSRPGVGTVLVGASSPGQLQAHLGARKRLGQDSAALAALGEISRRLGDQLPRVGNMFEYHP